MLIHFSSGWEERVRVNCVRQTLWGKICDKHQKMLKKRLKNEKLYTYEDNPRELSFISTSIDIIHPFYLSIKYQLKQHKRQDKRIAIFL